MNQCLPLSCLKTGQKAEVVTICTVGSMRRRLQDIGLIEGTCVECVQKGPCNDPIAFLIRGAIIALRCEDAKKIIVCMHAHC